jgi:transcriptional regulator with XRE-family HTH domain
VDDVRLGRLLRAVRRRSGKRQIDVAAAAGVSQQTVSRLERGHLQSMSLGTARRIVRSLEVSLDVSARWRGAAGDRLLDDAHARLVEIVLNELRDLGYECLVEYTFNHFGERGSVDVVGWQARSHGLVVAEIKSELVDTQQMNASLDRKVRLVPRLLAADRRWRAEHVARVLALPDRTAVRDAVKRHRSTFDATAPARNRELRAWLREPDGDIGAIWFLRDTKPASGTRVGPVRVRRATSMPVRRPGSATLKAG